MQTNYVMVAQNSLYMVSLQKLTNIASLSCFQKPLHSHPFKQTGLHVFASLKNTECVAKHPVFSTE